MTHLELSTYHCEKRLISKSVLLPVEKVFSAMAKLRKANRSTIHVWLQEPSADKKVIFDFYTR